MKLVRSQPQPPASTGDGAFSLRSLVRFAVVILVLWALFTIVSALLGSTSIG